MEKLVEKDGHRGQEVNGEFAAQVVLGEQLDVALQHRIFKCPQF